MNENVLVRQIAQFPQVSSALPDDLLVLQRFNLGGPYVSVTVAELLATALTNAPGAGIGLTYGSAISFSQNWPLGQGGAPAPYQFTAGSPGRPGFAFNAPVFIDNGDLTVRGSIHALGVYSGGFPVATVAYVDGKLANLGEFSVHSFNGRTGPVTLQRDDILQAGGVSALDARMQGTCLAPTFWNPLDSSDIIATTAWTQNAMSAAFESFLEVQGLVYSFNGRVGPVTLTLADVSLANNSVPGQFPTAPTPPFLDASSNIATTAFVHNNPVIAGGPYAPVNSPVFTGIPQAPTAANGTNTGQIATTAFVEAAIVASTTGVASFNTRTGAVTLNTADIIAAAGAPIASPALTGVPTAPTAAAGNNTTQLATTAFVENAITALGANYVASFNTRVGAVTLTTADVIASGALANTNLTGVPTAPTAAPGTNTTQVATTAYVQAIVGGVPSVVNSFNGRTNVITLNSADISAAGGALLASPALTGVPTAPNALVGTNSTQLATTAFVQSSLVSSTVSSFNTRQGAVTLEGADITGAGGALLLSPIFTGAPEAPTPPAGDNSTNIATTAFVGAAIAAIPPPPGGGVTSGNRVLIGSVSIPPATPNNDIRFFNLDDTYDLYDLDIWDLVSNGILTLQYSTNGTSFDQTNVCQYAYMSLQSAMNPTITTAGHGNTFSSNMGSPSGSGLIRMHMRRPATGSNIPFTCTWTLVGGTLFATGSGTYNGGGGLPVVGIKVASQGFTRVQARFYGIVK